MGFDLVGLWWVSGGDSGRSVVEIGMKLAVRRDGNQRGTMSVNSRLDQRGGEEAPSHKRREREMRVGFAVKTGFVAMLAAFFFFSFLL